MCAGSELKGFLPHMWRNCPVLYTSCEFFCNLAEEAIADPFKVFMFYISLFYFCF